MVEITRHSRNHCSMGLLAGKIEEIDAERL